MNDYLWHDYLPAFASTLAIELGVAVLLGFWTRRELVVVALVNGVSHPLLHGVMWIIYWTHLLPTAWPLLGVLEVAVCLGECLMLMRWLPISAIRAAWVAFAMNATSVLLGMLLFA